MRSSHKEKTIVKIKDMKKRSIEKSLKASNKTAAKKGENCLSKFVSSNCLVYGSLTIDIRRILEGEVYPAAVRIAFDGKKIWLRIGGRYSREEWTELCSYEKLGRNKKSSERKQLKEKMDKVANMVDELIEEDSFSLQRLKQKFQGLEDESNGSTIYTIWEQYINEKKENDKAGSARCSKDIYNRFCRDMKMNVAFADIDRSFILRWVSVMKKKGLSVTSIGISLRSFRTIVNICIDKGLVKGNTKDMFKDTGYNKSCSRKYEFLDVEAMKRLYDFWEKDTAVDENGKELFFPKEKHAVFRDLGLFLFMYLGDGQNLADTLRLTYDEWYFATHGKQLRFLRNKTKDRNESASEVIFPVTEELQKIMDQYASEPKLGRRVFPIMSELITPEQEIWVIQRYNKYVRKHMAVVADLIGMEQKPSPTWARHSFATNLNNSGKVPYKYISDSMGHSSSGDITSNYIGAYPLNKMLEYNWYLLHDEAEKNEKTDKQALISLLKNMSEEERKELLASV